MKIQLEAMVGGASDKLFAILALAFSTQMLVVSQAVAELNLNSDKQVG